MSQLMKSVSGIRGIVGETFTPELIIRVASAFSRYTKKGTIVIGRDTRPTGETISKMLESALVYSGCNVINIGIVPTPTTELMVKELKADGGIMISASHNPVEWNAFKLINRTGTFLNAKEIQKFFELMEKDSSYVLWNKFGKTSFNDSSFAVHIKKVLKAVNADVIQKKKYKVVLDSVNGAGSEITQALLSELNCEVVPLYCDINSTFPRGAEPTPENLKVLARTVKKYSADVGFAQDPDADRLAVVDENGKPIGEENTLALVTEHLLSKKKGKVVINLSTTKAIEDIAVKYGSVAKRTKVGEINVTEEMRKSSARIGGEGNGGVISPQINMGRDSLAGIGYILEMMAENRKTVSDLVKSIPQYVMKKGKIDLKKGKDNSQILKDISGQFGNEKISSIDGLRIDFKNHPEFKGGWVHLRPSNTEPVFRIISEGINENQAAAIYHYFAGLF
ncbi:MAG: phosphoglucosamine mutase [Spirochaetes bacterium]|nr:phosphoglucosamine mutase [Spirochaetota bacterium]